LYNLLLELGDGYGEKMGNERREKERESQRAKGDVIN
jgi:hypothetical protein